MHECKLAYEDASSHFNTFLVNDGVNSEEMSSIFKLYIYCLLRTYIVLYFKTCIDIIIA